MNECCQRSQAISLRTLTKIIQRSLQDPLKILAISLKKLDKDLSKTPIKIFETTFEDPSNNYIVKDPDKDLSKILIKIFERTVKDFYQYP